MDKRIRGISTEIEGHVVNARYSVNMNEIVGTHNILFVCLDTLRYDVAFEEQEKNNTPNLNKYGKWENVMHPVTSPFRPTWQCLQVFCLLLNSQHQSWK